MKATYNCAGNRIVLVDKLSALDWKDVYDQAISYRLSNTERIDVRILNKDGSDAEQCLNGIRALMHYAVSELGIIDETVFYQNGIYLASGVFRPGRFEDQDIIEVHVPFPDFVHGADPVSVKAVKDKPDEVNLGNKHKVYWLDKFYHCGKGGFMEGLPKEGYKPLETNEEYVCTVNGEQLFVNFFELGVGATGSCGSGAVAVAFSAYRRHPEGPSKWAIQSPGGALYVRVAPDEKRVYLSGPIDRVE